MIRKVARQQKLNMALNNYLKIAIFSTCSKMISINYLILKKMITKLFLFTLVVFFVSCSSKEKMNNVDNSAAFETKIDRAFIKEKVQDIASANTLVDETESIERPRRITSANKFKSQNTNLQQKPIEEISLPLDSISINFDGIPTKTALSTLATIIDRNIILDPEIKGEVEMELYNEPWANVFKSILELNDLFVVETKNTDTLKVLTRATKELLDSEIVEESTYYDTAFFSIYYNTASTMLSSLKGLEAPTVDEEGISTSFGFLSAQEINALEVLQADDVSQTIVASGPDDILNKIENILELIDVKLQQVYFEVFIVTASDNFEEEFGARLGLFAQAEDGSDSITLSGGAGTLATSSSDIAFNSSTGSLFDGLITGTSGVGLVTNIDNNMFKATLDLLEQDAISTTISSPKILVANGKRGAIRQQTDYQVIIYPIGEGEPSIESGSVGLSFSITPLIGTDENIKVTYAISESSTDAITDDMVFLPPITITEIEETEMFIKNKQIMVLGGIFTVADSVTKQKVPGLGDVPVLRWLTSNKEVNDDQQEIFIFIIPTIV